MKVTVRGVGLLRTLLGQEMVELSLPAASRVDGLVGRLAEIGDERLTPHVVVPKKEDAHLSLRVVVNGRDIALLAGRQTVLEDGDEVLVFVPLAGG